MLNLERKMKFLGPAADMVCPLPATDNTGTENLKSQGKSTHRSNGEGFRM